MRINFPIGALVIIRRMAVSIINIEREIPIERSRHNQRTAILRMVEGFNQGRIVTIVTFLEI